MIQAVLEILGEWLLSGSDKGLTGKIRKWLLIIFGGIFAFAIVFVYFVKLPNMSLSLAIALPVFTVLFCGVGGAVYFATRSKNQTADKD